MSYVKALFELDLFSFFVMLFDDVLVWPWLRNKLRLKLNVLTKGGVRR